MKYSVMLSEEDLIEVGVVWPPRDTHTLLLANVDNLLKLNTISHQSPNLRDIVVETPSEDWFEWPMTIGNFRHRSRPLKYKPSRISFNDKEVWFNNGRHRAKWLMTLGLSTIPIFVRHEMLGLSTKLGLAGETIERSGELSIPAFDYGDIIMREPQ